MDADNEANAVTFVCDLPVALQFLTVRQTLLAPCFAQYPRFHGTGMPGNVYYRQTEYSVFPDGGFRFPGDNRGSRAQAVGLAQPTASV